MHSTSVLFSNKWHSSAFCCALWIQSAYSMHIGVCNDWFVSNRKVQMKYSEAQLFPIRIVTHRWHDGSIFGILSERQYKQGQKVEKTVHRLPEYAKMGGRIGWGMERMKVAEGKPIAIKAGKREDSSCDMGKWGEEGQQGVIYGDGNERKYLWKRWVSLERAGEQCGPGGRSGERLEVDKNCPPGNIKCNWRLVDHVWSHFPSHSHEIYIQTTPLSSPKTSVFPSKNYCCLPFLRGWIWMGWGMTLRVAKRKKGSCR